MGDITVPGNWEVQGFGVPIYTNTFYEFAPHNPQPPLLPEDIPAGVYRRSFELPTDWDGSEIYLHVGAAKSGAYVYVNGKEVGYNEDSKSPAEYRITDFVKARENELALKILRWSTGSFLDNRNIEIVDIMVSYIYFKVYELYQVTVSPKFIVYPLTTYTTLLNVWQL